MLCIQHHKGSSDIPTLHAHFACAQTHPHHSSGFDAGTLSSVMETESKGYAYCENGVLMSMIESQVESIKAIHTP